MKKSEHPNWNLQYDLRFEDTFGVCLATYEEQHGLWARFHDDWGMDWEQLGMGWCGEIGKVAGRPVCVTVFWVKVHRRMIAFVDGTSQLVDHAMIDEWVAAVFPNKRRSINAANFHIIVHDLADELGVMSLFKYYGCDKRSWQNKREISDSYMKKVKDV